MRGWLWETARESTYRFAVAIFECHEGDRIDERGTIFLEVQNELRNIVPGAHGVRKRFLYASISRRAL